MAINLEHMDMVGGIALCKKEVMECISKYGSVREHNYWFFRNQQTDYSKVYFFRFDDMGIIAIRYNRGTWEIIGDVLAPAEKRQELFKNFLEYALINRKDKKVFAFVRKDFWNDIKSILHNSDKYRLTRKPAVYYTPIFDMDEWDGRLEGKRWKKLRNIRNNLIKSNKVEVVPSKEVDKKELVNVVHDWRKKRPNQAEKAYYTQMYMNFIKNDFEGTDISRSIVVNGKPCTITAGWKIPNSNNYYSAIGLHNYAYEGLAESAYVDDFIQIKSKGYKYVDLGDSTKSLMLFKKKFGPSGFYRTYWMHIVEK